MKVLPLSNYQQRSHYSHVSMNKQNKDTAFKGWNVKVLDLSEAELETVAKSFYKSSEEELKEVATVRSLLGIKLANKSLAAFYKLKGAVDKANTNVDVIKSLITTVEKKTVQTPEDARNLNVLKGKLSEYEDASDKRWSKYFVDDTPAHEEDYDAFRDFDRDHYTM